MAPDHDLLHKLQVEVVVGHTVHFAVDCNIATAAERILDRSALVLHSLVAAAAVVVNCTGIDLASPVPLVAAAAALIVEPYRRHLHSWVDRVASRKANRVASPNLHARHCHNRKTMQPLLGLAKTGVLKRNSPVAHGNDLSSLSQAQESTVPGLAMTLISCWQVM